jgi:hypothetical protein
VTKKKPAAAVRVDVVPLASLKPLATNPRHHGPRDLAYLQGVVERVGSARSGVIDDRGTILAGNGFHAAAKAAGQREAIIVDSDGTRPVFVRRRALTAAQRDEVIVADNRTSEVSTWDQALLAAYAMRVPELRAGWTDEEWAAAIGVFDAETTVAATLANAEKCPFQQMTFTLHDDQAQTVKDALAKAQTDGCAASQNENTNGNALASICEAFLHG